MRPKEEFLYKRVRLTMNKEQCEMIAYLKDYYQEPATHIVKKALEKLYYTIKHEEKKNER